MSDNRDIHIYLHVLSSTKEEQILELLEKIMSLSSEALAAAQAEATQVDSLIALFQGLQKQLADILAGVTLPPAVQADIDAIFALSNDEAKKIIGATTTTSAGKPAPVG